MSLFLQFPERAAALFIIECVHQTYNWIDLQKQVRPALKWIRPDSYALHEAVGMMEQMSCDYLMIVPIGSDIGFT